MGNTSSQLAAATGVPATQTQPSQSREDAQLDASASSPGSEIAVASPRSKMVTARTALTQFTRQEGEQSPTTDVEAKPKKRKRSMGGSGRAPRGRPRDPSQLKPEITAKPADVPTESPEVRSAPAKRRKLSKADEHMLEIASALLQSPDAEAGAEQEVIAVASPRRKAKERNKQGEQAVQAVPAVTVEKAQAALGEPTKEKELEDAHQVVAEASTRQEGQRVRETVKPGSKRRKSKHSPTAAAAVTEEYAKLAAEASELVRQKREGQALSAALTLLERRDTQVQTTQPPNIVTGPEALPSEEAIASASEEPVTRKRKRNVTSDQGPAQDGLGVQAHVSPASGSDERPAGHANGRRVSAVDRPGPPKGKRTMEAPNGETPEDGAQAQAAKQPTLKPTDGQLAPDLATWPAVKLRYFGEGVANWLRALPFNADLMPDHEAAIKFCEPKTTYRDLARELKMHRGMRFRTALLEKELQRIRKRWDASSVAVRGADGAGPSAQRIPTPPESPPVAKAYGVDATDQVREWLSSQEVPAPDLTESQSRVPNATRNDDDEDHSEYVPEQETEAIVEFPPDAQRKPSTTRKAHIDRPSKVNLPAPVDDGPDSGPFTDAEKAATDAVFEYVRQKEGMDALHMKAAICEWSTVGEFKIEVQEALPNRPKAAVRKFCRRRYAATKTGPWTAGEDEALRRAYVQFPNRWMEVSDLVGRSGDACRDRWRDHVQYGDDKLTGPWSQEEESKLVRAVQECIKLIKRDAVRKRHVALMNDTSKQEELVDWNTVAGKLEGKRTQRRCREKWQKLKRRGIDAHVSTQADATAAVPGAPAFDDQSKKQRAVESKIKQFQYGDYYDVLMEIHTAIEDHSKVFNEESTVWSIVSTKHPNSRFSGALRRRAYYAALKNYAGGKKVGKATTIAGKARAMVRSVMQWAEKNEIGEFVRAYNPVVSKEASKEAKEARKAVREAAAAATEKPKTLRKRAVPRPKKSREIVVESDEEDEAEEEIVEDAGVAEHDVSSAGQEHEIAEPQDEAEQPEADAADDACDASADDQSIAVRGGMQRAHDLGRVLEVIDDYPISSVNSRFYEASLSGRDPNLAPKAFVARCKALQRRNDGRRQRRTRA
ncbi:hypothetical protein LTR85_001696 [Meristemomyces frigidus]|nr:hypothetical protein LTR85_001696 [Meristemomyces frigidus]